jgi:hypothetical protein
LPEQQRKRRAPKAPADVVSADRNTSQDTAESVLNESVVPNNANVEGIPQISRVEDLAQSIRTRDGDEFGEVF